MKTSGVRPSAPINAEDLFRAHAPFVARLLTRLGVCRSELDDAVQEVFLVVHRHGGYVPGPATPTGYLTSIALRAASTYRRRGRKRRERRSEVAPEEVSSAALDPARALEVQQSLAELQEALDQLDPEMRATLVLAELEGESCLSIAATMQIAVGTVYWRLHRARKSFRAAIENRRVAEQRAGLAAGAFLFGGSSDGLLEAGRAHPDVDFDVASALERLRAALRMGVSIPPWASSAARAGLATGVSTTAPAILSALVIAHAVSVGASRWRTGPVAATSQASTAKVASFALGAPPETASEAAQPVSPDVAPSPEARPVIPTSPPRPAGRSLDTLATHREPLAPPAVAQEPGTDALRPGSYPRPGDRPAAFNPSFPDAMREVQEVASAQRLLTSDPAQALSTVLSGDARPSSYLREERHYIGVVALSKLGRSDEARAAATRFLAEYPDGPFSARVRARTR